MGLLPVTYEDLQEMWPDPVCLSHLIIKLLSHIDFIMEIPYVPSYKI